MIGTATAEEGKAGLGRVTLSRRERLVMVEPRGAGLVLITLRAADEVRPAEFETPRVEIDPEAVATAIMIIERRSGIFDPSTFRRRSQETLRELIEAKMGGLPGEAEASRGAEPGNRSDGRPQAQPRGRN